MTSNCSRKPPLKWPQVKLIRSLDVAAPGCGRPRLGWAVFGLCSIDACRARMGQGSGAGAVVHPDAGSHVRKEADAGAFIMHALRPVLP
jgi:hypothetical protein